MGAFPPSISHLAARRDAVQPERSEPEGRLDGISAGCYHVSAGNVSGEHLRPRQALTQPPARAGVRRRDGRPDRQPTEPAGRGNHKPPTSPFPLALKSGPYSADGRRRGGPAEMGERRERGARGGRGGKGATRAGGRRTEGHYLPRLPG